MKVVNTARLLPGVVAFSIVLLLTACGGNASNNGGGGTPTPPPTPTPSTANQWTWMSGANTANATGVYGTLGIASASNVPGARFSAVSWADSSGNLWLFGGGSYDSNGAGYLLNDLWEFNTAAKTWTWVSGSSTGNAGGVYGTQGVASASNMPGARNGAVSWTDSSGNFWLFGGIGYDSTGATGDLNDLWEFNPAAKTWTWVSGASTVNVVGVYGTQGVASSTNIPGARNGAVSWVDSSGNLWLFGGYNNCGSNNACDDFNDLWEFNPAAKTWTWVSGSNTANAYGVYGTLGVASSSNTPGSRENSVSWTDRSGNFWLFGGQGQAAPGSGGWLNDLWEFKPTAKTWTWVSGSSTGNEAGVYGTLGSASTANVPGGRYTSVGWIDGSGNLWLFGGQGNDSTGAGYYLNDLWEYSPTSKEWTWMSGSNMASGPTNRQPGIYGTLGIPAASNLPGARFSSVTWIDGSGNLWLFGGIGYDSTGVRSALNDLWRYQP